MTFEVNKMTIISLNCSSFVAKQYGYHTENDWGPCVDAVNAYYRPLETFSERFEELVLDVKGLGYPAIDVWTPGQLAWAWATDVHIKTARQLLKQYGISVTSIGGAFGDSREKFVSACELAVGIDTKLLSGTVPLLFTDRDFLVATLNEYDLKLAIENHPEQSAADMMKQIGDGAGGRIGTAVDTGWYATHGCSVPEIVHELREHILHIHLKDIQSVGEHVNVGYGQGVVPLEDCVKVLCDLNYAGDYSIENHAFDHDPTEELREALPMLQSWLKKYLP